jgi:GxxExxY protein
MNHEDHKDHKGSSYPPLPGETERVVREVIGAGLAVHRELGPGFIEGVYDRAVCLELKQRNLSYERQKEIQVRYRGETICSHRLDLVVGGCVIVEVKAVKALRPVHKAQILSYLKASNLRVGLLMNFNVKMFVQGLHRFVR